MLGHPTLILNSSPFLIIKSHKRVPLLGFDNKISYPDCLLKPVFDIIIFSLLKTKFLKLKDFKDFISSPNIFNIVCSDFGPWIAIVIISVSFTSTKNSLV